MALVLDTSDSTGSNPVHFISGGFRKDLGLRVLDTGASLESEHLLIFFVSVGGEFVVANSVSVVGVVPLADEVVDLGEFSESECVFLASSVALSVFGKMVHELDFD